MSAKQRSVTGISELTGDHGVFSTFQGVPGMGVDAGVLLPTAYRPPGKTWLAGETGSQ